MALSPGSTIVDYAIPTSRSRNMSLVQDTALIIAGSLLMALSAHVKFYLTPFVPVTLQTFVLMVVASSLGSRRAALTMLLYLAEGSVGLPVFTNGGGFGYLLTQPTAGYLVSYPFAAFAVGWLAEQGLERNYKTSILAMLPGTIIVYLLGVAWLALWLKADLITAITIGVLPFILGDLVKVVCAALLLPASWSFVRKFRGAPLVDQKPPASEE